MPACYGLKLLKIWCAVDLSHLREEKLRNGEIEGSCTFGNGGTEGNTVKAPVCVSSDGLTQGLEVLIDVAVSKIFRDEDFGIVKEGKARFIK